MTEQNLLEIQKIQERIISYELSIQKLEKAKKEELERLNQLLDEEEE